MRERECGRVCVCVCVIVCLRLFDSESVCPRVCMRKRVYFNRERDGVKEKMRDCVHFKIVRQSKKHQPSKTMDNKHY